MLLFKDDVEFTIYFINIGDTRGVIGKKKEPALRMTYDHKASDPEEQKRVEDGGG